MKVIIRHNIVAMFLLSVFNTSHRSVVRAFHSMVCTQSWAASLARRRAQKMGPLFWGEEDAADMSTLTSDGKGRKFRESRGKNNSGSLDGGGWDDFDEPVRRKKKASTHSKKKSYGNSGQDYRVRSRNSRFDNNFRKQSEYRSGSKPSRQKRESDENRITMRSFEDAGLEHLYGLAPILNALTTKRRDWSYKDDEDSGEDVKPSARLQPALFIQENKQQQGYGGKGEKVQEIISLASERYMTDFNIFKIIFVSLLLVE